MAQGSKQQTLVVKETSWGVIPGTPECQVIPTISNTLALTKSTLTDDTTTADGQVHAVQRGIGKVAGDIKTYLYFGILDDFLACALRGVWATNTLKAGTTLSSLGIEKGFTDNGDYYVYEGNRVNQLNIEFQPDALVTVTFGMVGKARREISSTSLDSTPTLCTVEPFNTISGSIYEGGTESAAITAISLTIDNQIDGNDGIYKRTIISQSNGKLLATGTITAVYPDRALITKADNETSTTIVLTAEDPEGNTLSITLPKVKLGDADPEHDGDKEVILSIPFSAIYDTTEGTTIKIVKTAAA